MGVLVCVCLPLVLLQVLLVLGSSPLAAAQQQPQPASAPPARALDAVLQEYAYRALVRRPRTGAQHCRDTESDSRKFQQCQGGGGRRSTATVCVV